jgi:hypothetical protein
MTVDALRPAHMQSAHDVLNAALLSLETSPKVAPVKRKTVQRELRLCGTAFVLRCPASCVLLDFFVVGFYGDRRLDARPEFFRLIGKLPLERREISLDEFGNGAPRRARA